MQEKHSKVCNNLATSRALCTKTLDKFSTLRAQKADFQEMITKLSALTPPWTCPHSARLCDTSYTTRMYLANRAVMPIWQACHCPCYCCNTQVTVVGRVDTVYHVALLPGVTTAGLLYHMPHTNPSPRVSGLCCTFWTAYECGNTCTECAEHASGSAACSEYSNLSNTPNAHAHHHAALPQFWDFMGPTPSPIPPPMRTCWAHLLFQMSALLYMVMQDHIWLNVFAATSDNREQPAPSRKPCAQCY